MRKSLRVGIAITTIAIAALATAGCSSSGSDSGSGAKKAPSESGPVKLTYWGWAPNMEKVVDVWNKDNPDIQVNFVKTDSGDSAVTKFLTAVKAGSGAPDIMQAEYQAVPELVASGGIRDISADIPKDLKSKFPAGVWSGVTLGTKSVYGIPQDSGPMMFYYRKDVFDSLGLTAPKTWDEYAADAKKIHDANPSEYLGTFSSADAGQFAGLTQQAGASWWSIKGSAWGVDIDSAASKKVADFWGGLVEQGVIDNQPQYTPAWNKALNDGQQVGWVSSVWAPGVLSGNAQSTAGKWVMAPLPQWDASANATGAWGGSSVAVSSQSKHVAAAIKFMTWLDTDPDALKLFVQTSGIYPADSADSAAALADPNPFFSNQPDFYKLAGQISQTMKPFTYGPNVNVAYSAFNDEFGKAAQAKSKQAFDDALGKMQSTTLADLKKSGFKIKG
jgi:multiple sugar transport system substrate-binding protein